VTEAARQNAAVRINPRSLVIGITLTTVAAVLAACSSSSTPAAASLPGAAASASGSPEVTGSPSATPTGSPTPAKPSPSAKPTATTKPAACSVLPSNDVWHADVSHLPLLAKSSAYVKSIGLGDPVHADFGSGTWDGGPIGIPITTVAAGQAKVAVSFQYGDESDAGPYPVPRNAKIEGGSGASGDRHVIVYDAAHCKDYELYAAYPQSNGSWKAGSGAVYDLRSNKLRHAGWTSADAAGLPILPGLVTYAEVASGHIDHAIRVTVSATQAAYLWPARHVASSSHDTSLPPMGLRLRLKASVDISHLPKQARIVATAMKKYGVIVADNGSSWYISGAPDSHWNNDQLHALGSLTGTDFEAVNEASLMVSSSSGATR
jgi:hypothetical protein